MPPPPAEPRAAEPSAPPSASPWHPRSIVARAMRGAAVGAIATVPMTAVQMIGRPMHRRRPPFEEVTQRLGKRLPFVPTPRRRTLGIASAVAHVGFGAGAGAVYAVLAPARLRFVSAPAYALAVDAASYGGWAPRLRLMPSPSRDETSRQVVTAVAHVVYGAGLAAGLEALDRRGRAG